MTTSRQRAVRRNPVLHALGALMSRTLRQRPELGLVAEVKISLDPGFWVKLHHEEPDPAAALVAWAELLVDPTIETTVYPGETVITHVLVCGLLTDPRGELGGVGTSVLASFPGTKARYELTHAEPTVHALRNLISAVPDES